jgi:hypothetical protein
MRFKRWPTPKEILSTALLFLLFVWLIGFNPVGFIFNSDDSPHATAEYVSNILVELERTIDNCSQEVANSVEFHKCRTDAATAHAVALFNYAERHYDLTTFIGTIGTTPCIAGQVSLLLFSTRNYAVLVSAAEFGGNSGEFNELRANEVARRLSELHAYERWKYEQVLGQIFDLDNLPLFPDEVDSQNHLVEYFRDQHGFGGTSSILISLWRDEMSNAVTEILHC